MDPALIWILVGVLLLGAEAILPGVYLLWIGLAALGTGLALLVWTFGFGTATALFLGLLAIGIGASLMIKRRVGPPSQINAPETGLAGRQAVVTAIEGHALRVRLGDSDWAARLPRGAAFPVAGDIVRVQAVDGTVLVVTPLVAKP